MAKLFRKDLKDQRCYRHAKTGTLYLKDNEDNLLSVNLLSSKKADAFFSDTGVVLDAYEVRWVVSRQWDIKRLLKNPDDPIVQNHKSLGVLEAMEYFGMSKKKVKACDNCGKENLGQFKTRFDNEMGYVEVCNNCGRYNKI